MGSQVVADVHLNQYFRSQVEISTLVEIMSNIPSQCSCVSMPFTDHCKLSVVCVVFVDLFIVFNRYGLAMSQFIVQLKISVSMMSSSILKANEQLTLSVLVLNIEINYSVFIQQKLQTGLHMPITVPYVLSYIQERSFYFCSIQGLYNELK